MRWPPGRVKAGKVWLDGWTVDGALVQPFTAAGTIDLTDAEITGSLSCAGARLTAGPGGNALAADRVKVGGDMSFDGVVAEAGALRLAAANIVGLLSCRGAQLTGADTDGNALAAYQMKAGNVSLDGWAVDGAVVQPFTAAGTIDLTDADISGDLNCTDAFLRDAGIAGDHKGYALYADGMRVGGDVNLGGKFGKFTAIGAVRLSGADVTGELICPNAFLIGPDGKDNALYANEVKVGGNVDFTGIFAVGTVSLRSATVGGCLRLKPRKLAGSKYEIDRDKVALDAAGAKISQELEWEPQAQVFGQVILEHAAVGWLTDNWADAPVARSESGFWPPNGRLRLDGLTYRTIGGSHPVGVGQRLKWIRSQYSAPQDDTTNFATQPYELLANVYQQAGQDTEARTVALARRRDLRRFGNLTWYRVALNWLLDKTIQYGYQTWRAILALAVVYVAAVVIFWAAQHHGNLIVPLMGTASGHQPPPVTQCTKTYPCFYPAGYAIDTVIPLINVHQATYWGPNGDATWGHALVVFTWVGTALGWALATLAVAGYTGLVRNSDAL